MLVSSKLNVGKLGDILLAGYPSYSENHCRQYALVLQSLVGLIEYLTYS